MAVEFKAADEPHTRFPKSQDVLTKWGIDPGVVSVDDWDDEGYLEFQIDAHGELIISRASFPVPVTVRKKWPEDGKAEILTVLKAELGR